MRAYKFLDAHFGLKSLYEKRLKQSRIHELNDPFELSPYDLTDRALREAFHRTRDELGRRNGLLCFSAAWHNPVVWAHYSDKYKGMCLGFEIPAIGGNDETDTSKLVRYIHQPLHFPADFLEQPTQKKEALVQTALFTKYDGWKYEQEIRIWATLQNEEGGLHFLDFGDRIRLVEVILGANNTLPTTAINRALGPLASEAEVGRARVAYDRFEIVKIEDRELGTK